MIAVAYKDDIFEKILNGYDVTKLTGVVAGPLTHVDQALLLANKESAEQPFKLTIGWDWAELKQPPGDFVCPLCSESCVFGHALPAYFDGSYVLLLLTVSYCKKCNIGVYFIHDNFLESQSKDDTYYSFQHGIEKLIEDLSAYCTNPKAAAELWSMHKEEYLRIPEVVAQKLSGHYAHTPGHGFF